MKAAFPIGEQRTPLMAGDPERLASKLNNATGLLGDYWSDFQLTFLKDPATRSDMLFLSALVNGEGLEEARSALRDYWRFWVYGGIFH